MLAKFNERSGKVLSLSVQNAQRLKSEFIGTEHVLLGIILEGGGVAAEVLANLNVTVEQVSGGIGKLLQPGTSQKVVIKQLPFSPRCRRALKMSSEAANQFGHPDIGTEHILLGLVRVRDGVAAQVLVNIGLTGC